MSQIICPKCKRKFERNEVKFHCNSGCNMSFTYRANKLKRLLFVPKSEKCPECGVVSFDMRCPSCNKSIPKGLVKKNVSIPFTQQYKVCPFCFERYERYEVEFQCKCGCTTRYKPYVGFVKRQLFAPNAVRCPKCGEYNYTPYCPHCHLELPKEMVQKKGYIISIIGTRNSGKTTYITTLIAELKKFFHRKFKISVNSDATKRKINGVELNTEERYERDFYNQLYNERICPANTIMGDPRNDVPLIYSLTPPKRKWKKSKKIFLVFYDTAGENFEDPKKMADNVKFLRESDAFIILHDTLSIPAVQNRLGNEGSTSSPFDTIISTINTYYGQNDRKQENEFLKKPIALVFSKFDEILNHPDLFRDCILPNMSLNNNSFYLEDSAEGVLMSEFESISSGIKAALKNWEESNYVGITSQYKNAKYFGFSALGEAPDKNNHIVEVKPYRVLDPLVWIMTQLNFPIPIIDEKKQKSFL